MPSVSLLLFALPAIRPAGMLFIITISINHLLERNKEKAGFFLNLFTFFYTGVCRRKKQSKTPTYNAFLSLLFFLRILISRFAAYGPIALNLSSDRYIFDAAGSSRCR